jgi:hypothetical protein
VLRFEDRTEAVGVRFLHVNGARGQKWMPETMGGGVGVLDYDGDGRPDLVFVSGAFWPGDPREGTQKTSLVLFRNEGNGPDGTPRFRDVTREAGLRKVFYGMGVAVGDYDNDGRDDLYVTALGGNFLFHNLGGRFEEVATRAGVKDSGWGTSAVWLDFDGDGLLDLFVCRYVDWSPKTDLFCTLDGHTKSYCTPERYPGVSSHLYRNRGNGRFEDVTKKAGLWNENQKALGAAGSVRRERHGAEQPLSKPGQRHLRGCRGRGGRCRRRGGTLARGDGRRLGRHPQRQRHDARGRQFLQRAQVPLLDGPGRSLPR